MKIAIIQTNLIEPTGGERQSLMLALKLQKMGHDVTIFTQSLSDTCFSNLQKQLRIVSFSTNVGRLESTIVTRRFNYSFLYNFRYLKNLFQMRSFYKQLKVHLEDFDIVNPHNFPTEWLAFWIKMDFPNKKVVWMCNEPPFWYFNNEGFISKALNYLVFRFFDRSSVKNIDRIVVLDELNKKRVSEIYHRDASLVRSGVDVELKGFDSSEVASYKKSLGLNEYDFVVLSVATLARYKRPDKIILAVHELRDKIASLKAVLVGSGEMREELDQMIKELHLEDKILFLNHLSENDLIKTYQMSNVFVFPANQTWGLSAIEAMLHEKLVLVSRDCGVSEVVSDGGNAFLINGEDPSDIAEKILQVFSDIKRQECIGTNAREFVVKNLSWDAYARNIFDEFCKEVY